MNLLIEIILIVVVVTIFLELGAPRIIHKWLIILFNKENIKKKNTIREPNHQATRRDIRIELDEAKEALSTIRNLQSYTEESIVANINDIKSQDLAKEKAESNKLSIVVFLKQRQELEIKINLLERQKKYLFGQEERIQTVVEKLKNKKLLTNSELVDLSRIITQSLESLVDIGSQYQK